MCSSHGIKEQFGEPTAIVIAGTEKQELIHWRCLSSDALSHRQSCNLSDVVTDYAGEQVVFGQGRWYGALREDVVVIRVGSSSNVGRQAKPVLRIRVDLGCVGSEGSLHLLPVVANEDFRGEAI